MNSLLKKALAECIGTFVLVFAACGVAAATAGSLVATALTFGLVIVAMAYSIGRVSGCHINPAVSLGCLLTKRMNVTDEKAGMAKKAGIVIGLTLTLVHLIGILLTGTSVNPARSLATALAAWIYNGTTDALAQVWMFIVAPLAGAALAAVLYKVLNTEKDAE